MTINKKPGGAGGRTPGLEGTSKPHVSSTARKWQRVLRAFADGRSLNRWEAVRELRDWCLHTTVAGLEARGVRIDRVDEVVPGQFGPIHCKRYRLAPESRAKAAELLGINGDSNAVA